MNPRAAINDLHPFQGCPFSHLGYFSKCLNQYLLFILYTDDLLHRYCKSLFTLTASVFSQRRGWDSNPRALADKRFSRPPRYDHFDTSPHINLPPTIHDVFSIIALHSISVNMIFRIFRHDTSAIEKVEDKELFGTAAFTLDELCSAAYLFFLVKQPYQILFNLPRHPLPNQRPAAS